MKKTLTVGLVLMGFSFTVTQALLIRELLVAFFGNELSIGLILASWLVLEAVGSGLLGGLADRWGTRATSFAALQVLFAVFLPLCLYGTYASRSLVGAIPGEGVGLGAIFVSSFLILAPLALVDGAMFTFGCRLYARLTSGGAPSAGWVYVLEALGAIAGGVIFTYLFIPFLGSVRMVMLLAALNLLLALLVLLWQDASSTRRLVPKVRLVAVSVLLLASLGALILPSVRSVQEWAIGQQWPGYDVVYSQNSVYGNVSVIRREAQYTFYADGMPILSAPVPDVALSEELVHLPLLFVPRPQRALVLSGGVGGVLQELEKYPLQQIDYAELDPLLIEAVERFPTPLTVLELDDPRLNVELVDGRRLVAGKARGLSASAGRRYDLVIVNLPYPSTLQLNRFYTSEFFHSVRKLLAERGVLVVSTPGRLSYMSEELLHLNAMTHRTLQEAFPHVRPIPGDLTLWLASPSDGIVSSDVESLVARWQDRSLPAQLMTPAHIRIRLDRRYLDWFWDSLGGEAPDEGVAINRDLHPVGVFYGLSYWNALFSPTIARMYAVVGRLKLWMLGLIVAGGAVLVVMVARRTARQGSVVLAGVIATTGFAGMTADLIVIFAFQTLYGYVYHWIALLIAAFMVGLSLGGLLMTRGLQRVADERRALLTLEGALLLFWLVLPLALTALYSYATHPHASAAIQGFLLLANALAGFLVGAQFPLANQMWLRGTTSPTRGAGALYASDLVGAFLGAILVSVVLIPILGIPQTCLLAAVLKLGSLSVVAALCPRS